METIKNLNTLKAISKKYKLEFCKKFKYCIKDNDNYGLMFLKNRKFKLKYFEGCFNPFLIQIN
jgi:hypothetical protein